MLAVMRLRFAGELRFFLAVRHRDGDVAVVHDGTSSLGHVVEALGVPLTEVGRMVATSPAVPSRTVQPSYRPRGDDLVDVAAIGRPQPLPMRPPRFLLDVHLGTLARRLRVLGVDAAYESAAGDDALLAAANAENRMLLTQDRGLLRRRALRHGAYVRGARPDDQLRDVVARFTPAFAPFTRCTACNGVLQPVRKEAVLHLLQPGTRRRYHDFARCPRCGRVYWRGAHAERLDAIVAASAGTRGPRPGEIRCPAEHRNAGSGRNVPQS
jgi:uncharacterized protein